MMVKKLREPVSSAEIAKETKKKRHKEGLSQWDLMRIKFKRNQLAVISGWVVLFIYLVVIFADFISPYAINYKNEYYVNAPPMRVRIFDQKGLSRPFVYAFKFEIDKKTFLRIYTPDTSKKYYVKFFVKGEEYRLFGLFKARIRLLGIDEGGAIYLLGTDRFGQCVFSRILAGARVTLTAGLLGVLISVILGSVLGTLSGFYGGTVDMVVQRIIEFVRSFPRIPLWLTLAAALPATWSSIRIYFGIVTILAFIGWTGLAREVRGKVLTMRGMEYTMAAKAGGASNWYIITRHMIPNSLSHIIVVGTLAIPTMILGESSLSFLGLGIKPPMTSLGVLLQEAQNVRSIANYPWLFTPAIFIIVSILAFNFLGDGLRDAADPYSH